MFLDSPKRDEAEGQQEVAVPAGVGTEDDIGF